MIRPILPRPGTSESELCIRAQGLFPRRPYLSESAVRHARREWVKKAMWLMSEWNHNAPEVYHGAN